MNGGEVIGSGGFSCIFRPALTCKNNKENNYKKSDFISKLLFNKHASEEINEIIKIKPIIKKIPNNKKYFLITTIKYCTPDTIPNKDIKNIEACKKFFDKNKFNYNELNDNLDNFTIINTPYGGDDLEKYIMDNNIFDISSFLKLNKLLIELLNKAIIPCNNLNLYHLDIKDSNILYKKNEIKIIDWGLSFILNNNNYQYNNNNINNNLYSRPLQFNLPYSILLLHDLNLSNLFIEYSNYYNIIENKKLTLDTYKTIFTNIFNDILKEKYGHNLVLVNTIIPLFYNNGSDEDNFKQFINIMSTIYANIFNKFYNQEEKIFPINDYIKKIFLPNCDIFGLLSIYITIYEKMIKENKYNRITFKIKELIKKYLFDIKYYLEPFNNNDVLDDLNELNNIESNIFNLNVNKKSKKKLLKQNNKTKKI